jgi:hypothetical protein
MWEDGNKKGKLSFPLSKQAIIIIIIFIIIIIVFLLSFLLLFLFIFIATRAIYYFIARTLASQLLEIMH